MNEQVTQQNVIIKGTKDGLVILLDDQCGFKEIISELQEKLSSNFYDSEGEVILPVKVQAGHRYVSQEQRDLICEIIRQKKNLVVEDVESNVVTKEYANEWKKKNEMVTLARTVRSGQVLSFKNDVLLIGDINPGGKLVSTGSIFVLGSLKGIAHAGCEGDTEAVIAASNMIPTQLRIADLITRGQDRYEPGVIHEMECAYINEQRQMIVESLQQLIQLRPKLNKLEGGI